MRSSSPKSKSKSKSRYRSRSKSIKKSKPEKHDQNNIKNTPINKISDQSSLPIPILETKKSDNINTENITNGSDFKKSQIKLSTRDLSDLNTSNIDVTPSNNSIYTKNQINHRNSDMNKYVDEFMKIREFEDKDCIKFKLPKLFNKSQEEMNLEQKYQLGGLVHEKEEFNRQNKYEGLYHEKRGYDYSRYDRNDNFSNGRYNKRSNYNNNWKRNKYKVG